MRSSIRNFLLGASSGESVDLGLLLLRVVTGASLFLKHGLEKLTGYATMVQNFPDPVHIGAHAGLAFALFTDGICSLLVIFGLATRPAAALSLVNLLTAFVLVHHAAFFGRPHEEHGELMMLYIVAFTAILFAGPGRFSIDFRLRR